MKHAFLIGCGSYDDGDIASLRFAQKDVAAFRDVLAGSCGFSDGEITMLTSESADPRLLPTYNNILRETVRGPAHSGLQAAEQIIFFYSGHGFHSPSRNRDYLVPQDAISSALEDSCLPFDTLLTHLYRWGPRTLVLFLDACRAAVDGAKSIVVSEYEGISVSNITHHGMVIFSSCGPHEKSYESPQISHSIFTRALCAGLSDAGQCATVAELDAFLASAVPKLSEECGTPPQHPYSRAEPLAIQSTRLVSPAKELEWRNRVPGGSEVRRSRVPRSRIAAAEREFACALDFGTSYSLIWTLGENGEFVPIPSPSGKLTVPSVVGFHASFDYAVGWDAFTDPAILPENRFVNVKRLFSRGEGARVNGRAVSAEFLASTIIRSLRRNAEEFLGWDVDSALVAIPANFSIPQANALARACSLAGFRHTRMIGEPCAAALLLYGSTLHQETDGGDNCHILVLDLGGGTLDVSVLNVGMGVYEVVSVAGDDELGGVDYDSAIYDYASARLASWVGDAGLSLSEADRWRLRTEAERAKIALGSMAETSIIVPGIESAHGTLLDVSIPLSRQTLFEITRPLDQRIRDCIQLVLKRAEITPRDLRLVMLTGQGSKIAPVKAAILDVVGDVPLDDAFQENAVVRGLCQYTGVLSPLRGKGIEDLVLVDANYTAVGILGVEEVWTGSAITDTDCAVSAGPTENRHFVEILGQGRIIPTIQTASVTVRGPISSGLALEVVELSALPGRKPVRIATIPIAPGELSETFEIGIDCDSRRTIVLWIKLPRTREIRGYQINNLLLDPITSKPSSRYEQMPDGTTRNNFYGLDLRGYTIKPVQKLETEGGGGHGRGAGRSSAPLA
jgi:molecular chaperone DnaK